MIDKNFCISSYLAFRYIEDENMNFYNGLSHTNFKPVPRTERIGVNSAEEIDFAIRKQLELYKNIKKGVMLSGGIG